MNSLFLSAIKTKRLDRWCKAGAWCILGLGLLSVALNVVNAWHMRIQLQVSQFVFSQNTFPNPSIDYFNVLPYLATACQAAILPVFLFVVLYGTGSVLAAITASTVPTPQDTEGIVYESLEVSTTGRR